MADDTQGAVGAGAPAVAAPQPPYRSPESLARIYGFPTQADPNALPAIPRPDTSLGGMAHAIVTGLLAHFLPTMSSTASATPASPSSALRGVINGAMPSGYKPPPMPSLGQRLGLVSPPATAPVQVDTIGVRG